MPFFPFTQRMQNGKRGIGMGSLSFRKKKKIVNMNIIRQIAVWILEILVVIVLAFFLVWFVGKKVVVIGSSMEPTLKAEETILVNRLSYILANPKRNDIIVFKPNGNENSHYYIKRVVGLPGETLQIIDGKLQILDEKQEAVRWEEVVKTEAIEYAGVAAEPIKLDSDEYFVLGDNWNFSEDSRYADIGNVKKEDIEGKAWCVKNSFFHFQWLK